MQAALVGMWRFCLGPVVPYFCQGSQFHKCFSGRWPTAVLAQLPSGSPRLQGGGQWADGQRHWCFHQYSFTHDGCSMKLWSWFRV